jgi:hypothetical protein
VVLSARARAALASSAALLAHGARAARGDEPPTCALHRIPTGIARPRIDGDLSDPVWRDAAVLGDLTQVEPIAGAAPSERTVVRLAYDARGLYIALECFDREPSGIRATQMMRDAVLDPDDRVEILIDTFLDRRNAFWFQIGAAGSLGDALVARNGGSFNKRWDGIWSGAARVTDAGWQAELEIPMATLSFDPDGSAWGFNLRRHIRRRTEEARWSGAENRIDFFSVANAGTLTGLSGLEQGLGLDLKPFAVVESEHDAARDDTDTEPDAGLDLFWRLTPKLKLSASLNTDFAETEVDERLVNLTRFPLFFPEKRDFFLEDSGVFEFASAQGFDGPRDVIPFFSRRIGLDANGAEVPLAAAAKLTGRAGGFGFGLMQVETDEAASLDRASLFVGRLQRDVLGQSDAGLIFTRGDPTQDASAETYGADLNLRTDEFLGDRNLRLASWVLQTSNEGAGSDDLAYGALLSYPNDVWEWSLGYTAIGDDFDPRLGFVPRRGIEKHAGALSWSPRLNTSIRQLEFSLQPTWITDRDGETQTEVVDVQPFGLELESGDQAQVELVRTREVLDRPFDIHPGVTIPPGDYEFERVRLELETSDKRHVSCGARVEGGEFFDGDSFGVGLSFDLRASARFLFGADFEREEVDLPGGEFTVHVARSRVDWVFSPALSWTSIVQWDDVSEAIGLDSRVWWILSPGSDFYFVVDQAWSHASSGLTPVATGVAAKLGYTFRF